MHAFLHTAQGEPRGRRHGDPAAVVLDRELELRIRAKSTRRWRGRTVGGRLGERDAVAARLRVLDGVGQAFLDAAIDREVDLLAVARRYPGGRERKGDPRML